MIICQICKREFSSWKGFTNHLRTSHKEFNPKSYYDKFLKKENEGICKLPECGKETNFSYISEGYRDYCCTKHSMQHSGGHKSKKYFIDKFGEIDGLLKYEKSCKDSNTCSSESFINRYGEVEGNKKYKEFIKKDSESKIGTTHPEKDKTSLEGYILREGIQEGTKKYNEKIDNLKYKKSLKYNIDKYGEVEGTKKYNKLIEIISNRLSDARKKLTPDIILKRNEGIKKSLNIPEIKQKQKDSIKESLKNPQTKLNQSIASKKSNFKRNENKILKLFNSDDFKDKFEILDEISYKGYKIKCKKCSNIIISSPSTYFPRCLNCTPINSMRGKSFKEQKIQSFLEKYYEIESNKWFFINSKKKYELDIYIPGKNLGIEFDGVYWHSEISGTKDKSYHINKQNFFKEKGIQVLFIREDEWENKQEIIKSILLSKINKFEKRIHAKSHFCQIRPVENKIAKEFLEINHLQGSINSKINLGLFYKDELVQVVTFSKPRFNKNYEFELLRFASKLNFQVIEGFSFILNYFIKNYTPKSIITYADRRYSNGNIYEKCGFKKLENSKPNYFYFSSNNFIGLESRLKFQKHKLKDILEKFDESLTEWENMQMNGYDRIFDCGNYVFEIII